MWPRAREVSMPADAPRGNRVFRPAVRARLDARRLWHAQRELESEPRDGDRPERSAEPKERSPGARWVADAQAALGGRVFRVPISALADLRHRIEMLDRRASRLGVAPIRLVDMSEREHHGH